MQNVLLVSIYSWFNLKMSIKQGKGAEALPRGPLIIDALRPRQLPQIWQLRRLLIYLSMVSNLSTPLAKWYHSSVPKSSIKSGGQKCFQVRKEVQNAAPLCAVLEIFYWQCTRTQSNDNIRRQYDTSKLFLFAHQAI